MWLPTVVTAVVFGPDSATATRAFIFSSSVSILTLLFPLVSRLVLFFVLVEIVCLWMVGGGIY